jgi:hypothetical protein
MQPLVASREIECLNGDTWEPGHIHVYQPEKNEVDWTCRFEIAWPGFRRTASVVGYDAYQALELALRAVPSEIEGSEIFGMGKLRLRLGAEPLNQSVLDESFYGKRFGDAS